MSPPGPKELQLIALREAAQKRGPIPYAGQPKGDTGRTPQRPVDQSPEAKERRSQIARKRVKRKRKIA